MTKRIVVISHNVFGYHGLTRLTSDERFELVGNVCRTPTTTLSDYRDSGAFCSLYNIPHHKTEQIGNPETIEWIADKQPDAILVLGWSQLIRDSILDIAPTYGTHPSLLPKNRGRGAIPWQIINNETESGLTMFRIPKGTHPVDSGDIYAVVRYPIAPDETAQTLYRKATEALLKIIDEELLDILEGRIQPIKQDESQATYLERRKPSDSELDWSKPPDYNERFVRALTGMYPPPFTYDYHTGKKLIIREAKIINNDFIITKAEDEDGNEVIG